MAGTSDLVGSTADAVKRIAPDVTPVKNPFLNSCTYGSFAFAEVITGSSAFRRATVDEINCTYEKIPVEEAEEFESLMKTSSCSYGGSAFAKIATPLKSACRNSFVTFAMIGYTVRVKGICRIIRWISDDVAHESEEGNELISGDGFGMPLKNEGRNVYTLDFLTFARIGYAVRVNGLYRIGRWIKDPNTISIIISFTIKLARNARMLQSGQRSYKFIPGKAAFFIILSKSLVEVVFETIELSKEEAGSPEKHRKRVKSDSNVGGDYFSAAFRSLKHKLRAFAMDEILVFMMKEFRDFMTKDPLRTQFLMKQVCKMEVLMFMMREFFVFMMKQIFGNQFYSGIDEIIVAVLRQVIGDALLNGRGFHQQRNC